MEYLEYKVKVQTQDGDRLLFSDDTFGVIIGEETDGSDLILEFEGSISGYVYRADSRTPVVKEHINVCGPYESEVTRDCMELYVIKTDDNSSYIVDHLQPGIYGIQRVLAIDQFADRVSFAGFHDNTPWFFSISSKFITEGMKGHIEHPVIGCHVVDEAGFRLSRTPAEPLAVSCLG